MIGEEKLLPQSMEAEAGVLGSILVDPQALRQVRGFLQPADFFRASHRDVYQAIIDLWETGTPADFITLGDELQRRGKLEAMGGWASLSELSHGVPTSGHAEHYGHIVERTAVLRRLIHAAGQIAAVAYSEPDADSAISQARKLIAAAAARRDLHDSIPLDQAIRNWLQGVYDTMDAGPRGLMSGFTELDRLTMGFHPGEQWLVTAPTSGGKSVWALSVATTIAKRQAALAEQGKKAGPVEYITREMDASQHVQRMIAAWCGVNGRALRADFWDGDRFDAETFHSVEPGAIELAGIIKGYLRFDDESRRVSEIEANLERAVEERGCPIAFIDYITLLDPENSRLDDRGKVNELTWRMKQLAMKLRIPIICLMQMNRKFDARENKRPQLTDLKSSSDAEQNADGVIGIHIPKIHDIELVTPGSDVYNPLFDIFGELWVLKARGSVRDAWAPFQYEGEYTRCSNWDRHAHPVPMDPTRPGSKAA